MPATTPPCNTGMRHPLGLVQRPYWSILAVGIMRALQVHALPLVYAQVVSIIKCFYVKSQFPEKNPVLLIDKFPSFALLRNAIMLQHLIIQFPLYYPSNGRLQEVKNKLKKISNN